MDVKKFREIIKQRENTDNEWDYGIEQCWKQEIEILSEDISSTIEFLKNECTAGEFVWISEVFEDIVENNPCKELIDCYKSLMMKYPEESSKYYIDDIVVDAERILEREKNNGTD